MKQVSSFFLVVFFCVSFLACKKSENSTSTTHDIYVAGTCNGYPTLWKNGLQTSLLGPSNYLKAGTANAVFVVDSNVYVVGQIQISDTQAFPALWKNGVLTLLSNFKGSANSIYVVDTTIYIVGYLNKHYPSLSLQVAFLWKNGVIHELSNSVESNALSVFVHNNDVYISGTDFSSTLWVNGVPTKLSVAYGGLISVFVNNNDVYAVGDTQSVNPHVYLLWKNGVPVVFSDNKINSLTSVFVDNNNVYCSGNTSDSTDGFAALWKNGVMTKLPKTTNISNANSVFVLNGNTYVAGSEYSGSYYYPVIWINNKEQVLAYSDGTAKSIYVK